ncbi:hypothetical protein J1605_006940 [Eschrichtius robustus]|uniref:ZAD domain-containing protein n=1 Tax=Eschrichtius robustus TaxID=9764 RepID=A0AB34H508_ESCRO|nr:hypothetical protein J1605_006940 [Eschrichtius robustus]
MGHCRLCHGKFSSRSLRSISGRAPGESSERPPPGDRVFVRDFQRLLGVAVHQDPALSQFVCRNCHAQFYQCHGLLTSFLQRVNVPPTGRRKPCAKRPRARGRVGTGRPGWEPPHGEPIVPGEADARERQRDGCVGRGARRAALAERAQTARGAAAGPPGPLLLSVGGTAPLQGRCAASDDGGGGGSVLDLIASSPQGLRGLVGWVHGHAAGCVALPSLQRTLSSEYCGIVRAVWGCDRGHDYTMDADSSCGALLLDGALGVRRTWDKDSAPGLPRHRGSSPSGAAPQSSRGRATAAGAETETLPSTDTARPPSDGDPASSKPAWAQGTAGGRGWGPRGARRRLVSEALLSQLQVTPGASASARWDQCGRAALGGPLFGARSHGTVGWAPLFADVVLGGPGWLLARVSRPPCGRLLPCGHPAAPCADPQPPDGSE